MPKFINSRITQHLNKYHKFIKGIKGYPFLFFATVFVIFYSNDIIFRFVGYGLFFDLNLLHLLVINIAWTTIFMLILLLVPNVLRKTLILIVVLVLLFFTIIQTISVENHFGVLSVGVLNDTINIPPITNIVKDTLSYEYLLYLLPLCISLILVFSGYRFKTKIRSRITFVVLLVLSLVVSGSLMYYPTFNNQVEYTTMHDKLVFMEEKDLVATRAGVITYLSKDAYNFYSVESTTYNLENNGENLLGQLEAYLSGKTHNENAYSDIYKDKNLIMIQAESLDLMAVREDVMPTLYSLMWSGLQIRNFISPIYSRATGDAEFAVQTGIIPSTVSTNSMRDFASNGFPESIAEMFNREGYYTMAFHGYDDSYYPREEFYETLGYDLYRNASDLGIKVEHWTSDMELISKTYDTYITKPRFFVNYITTSTHPEYTSENPIVESNYIRFKDFETSEKIKNYYSACRELDDAIKQIMTQLTINNRLDETVIVVYGNHIPISITPEEIRGEMPEGREGLKLYRTPLVVWSTDLRQDVVEEPMNSIDIVPTLANMFGLNIDYTNYVGVDIFSRGSNIAFLENRSWISKSGEYNSITQSLKLYDEKYRTDFIMDYVRNVNEDVANRFTYSRILLDKNFFMQTMI